MITSIQIGGCATFGDAPETMTELKRVNFVYGSNGTGKTTISRLLADSSAPEFAKCSIAWAGNQPLKTMVYNRDFVTQNFSLSVDLPGVFTLGQDNIETKDKIATAKQELDSLRKLQQRTTENLKGADGNGGTEGDIAALDDAFVDRCWKQKTQYYDRFQEAFKGSVGKRTAFRDRVLKEFRENKHAAVSIANLESQASTLFGEPPVSIQRIPSIKYDRLTACEANPILSKIVVGKTDVDIAALIQRVGNSDWVRAGMRFFESDRKLCPFCQQEAPEGLTESLNAYFDESFERDTKAIAALQSDYVSASDQCLAQIDGLIAAQPPHLDIAAARTQRERVKVILSDNQQLVAQKTSEPSRVVELKPVSAVLNEIGKLIDAANANIDAHNALVANFADKCRELIGQVWRHVVMVELKDEIEEYEKKRTVLQKKVSGLQEQLATGEQRIRTKEQEIKDLEKDMTSIRPSVDAINGLLGSLGFRGFSVAIANDGASYRLVRQDGSEAKDNLSEGERTFITFLYFYQIMKGSDTSTGITADRVVVFDDPISSLDSDILFVVSNLIKGIIGEAERGTGHVKQVFVLTHNVYFHKEVTFHAKRPKKTRAARHCETFWVVRKPDLRSKVVKHDANPITTSYELLWNEVRREDPSKLTIQNTLRRILENYFELLGGIDPDAICQSSRFTTEERLICRSLFSWVNDGSHFAQDDLYVSIDDSMVSSYLLVFRKIFEDQGHMAHYNMMMGLPDADDLEDESV